MKTDITDQDLIETSIQLIEDFDRAWNERDAEALAELFTEEADFQFYYGLMVRGREKIQKYYRDKVFPYLPEGQKHVTKSPRVRRISDGVLIGDGRVDLMDIDEKDPVKAVQKRLKVTSVVVKVDGEWKYSAVRVMRPVKD